MTLSMNRDQTLKSGSTNPCCDHWKKKYSKVQESRNALRQAVKVLEIKINEIQSRSSNACGAKVEGGDKLGEFTAAKVPLGSETSSFEPQIDTPTTQQGFSGRGDENGTFQTDRIKEIGRLKELLEVEKGRADSESKKAAEACKLLEDEKNKAAEKENEIGRLKGLLDVEKRRASSESKKAAEAYNLVGEEKKKAAEKENEISRLKKLIEAEKRRDDSERNKDAEVWKLLGEEKNKVFEKEKEISRLKELIEAEKRRDDSERKKDNELWKLLGEEKNKVSEKEKEISRLKEFIEAEKRSDSERKKDNDELCKLLEVEKNKVAEKEKEIGKLKEFIEAEKRRNDSERKKVNEVCKLLGEEKNKVAEKEKEISGLKEFIKAENRRDDSERKKDNELCKLLGEERNKVAEKEKEIGRLKEFIEAEKRRDDSERKKDNEVCKLLGEEKNKVAENEKEICRLKELVEEKKRMADSDRKKASAACKLLEGEKKKAAEKGEIARVEAEKYRTQIGQLEKQVNEAKTKLVSEISMFKEATKKFEADKSKLLAEKRKADSALARANEMLEVEKQKVDKEKRRADSEMVKLEEQKALAEDNWNKFMKEKCLTDQMSRQLEEDKKTIEDFKQKILELSSLAKPVEMATHSKVKAESTKMKLLKNKLKLEKLRAKHIRQKYKLEASRYDILRNELGRLKINFIQFLHHVDMLDASFSPVAGTKREQTKHENILDMQNSNVIRQIGKLNLSAMRGQFDNEVLEPCCTTVDASDPLRKNSTPHLTPGGNCSESITGIGSKLEPLVRGSNRTKLQSSAVNSSTESFSDGQLMGSQDASIFPVTASAQLTQEIFNAKQNMCNPSDKSIDVHHKKRKRMHDTVEYIANLSSEKLSDFHGLLYRKLGECLGGKAVLHNPNNVQEDNKRAHKKRKKSRREKVDIIPWVNRDEKKATAETNSEVYDDANVCRHTSCPPPHSLEITQACGERICDVANNFDTLINIDKVPDENYMKLLELENAFSEECYRKAMDFPLSPSLPEIEFHEIFDEDTLMIPSQHKSLPENVLSSRTDLLISPSSDVELISSAQKYDDCGVSCNLHVNTENSRTAFPVEDGIGSLNNKLPEFCVVFSNIMDNNIISRILTATKKCIAQCNLSTQTSWAFSNILTALKMEEKLTQKERVSVLLTLMLFNFSITTTKTFGRLLDGKSFQCLRSYYEHICTVMTDAETRILFVENYSLYELLHLIEDFLIEGKVIVNNRVDAETLSSDLRANDFLSCVNEEVSSDAASSEQLVAASIILSSVCAATDYVGFICDASYHILRSSKLDSLMVLTILHIFSYLGGDKFFNKNNFGLTVTVLKSLIMFLEDGSLSVATACLPSINQLHAELCMDVKCPFLEGAESIDAVASLLLEEIKRVHSSESRFMSVQCAIDKPCSEKCLISAPQPDARKTVDCCCLSDVLSLVELVANKMSWHWADMKLVPHLLHILDSCVDENFAIRIIVLLGQLGRNGVDVGGFEDQGVRNLRCFLFAYFSRSYSMKADLFLQFATASALFGLLPLDFETLFHSNINLSAYSISNTEILRKWFSGLSKDQQKLLFDVYNK
ncbi:hypothetical protein LR48_Vigan07g030200 [Vigna angularis]|nr:uncharacterized protein LOC108338228 [Vigna angularis]KOM46598.1 hypothetical protein LR48_Vigan07g030200 [Vigna angularis]